MNLIRRMRSHFARTAEPISTSETGWTGVEVLEGRSLFSGTLATVPQFADITDGTSNTFLIAEKYVPVSQTRQVSLVQDL